MKQQALAFVIGGLALACSDAPAERTPAANAGDSAAAAPATAEGPASYGGLAVGDTVEVSWTGSWYPAVITAVRPGEYRVDYVGWDSNWDEWVEPDRIRGPAQGTTARTGSSPARKGEGDASTAARELSPDGPQGRYTCTTFDAGQLNRVAELVLSPTGRYRDLTRGGTGSYRYQPDSRQVRFTSGPQQTDAQVVFDPTLRQGRGALVFTYPDGSRLDCYR